MFPVFPFRTVMPEMSKEIDMGHVFSSHAWHLAEALGAVLPRLKQDGMIWVSWPKKSSNVPTDITEDTIRAMGLPLGLVDVKVRAVDDIWSGLKLVIRKELRKTEGPTERFTGHAKRRAGEDQR